jgi:hypothetical protein
VKAKKKEAAPAPESPPVNAPLPESLIARLAEYYAGIEKILDEHAAHLSPQDRRRLNGAGAATLGFINEAYNSAQVSSELLPHHVPLGKFREDYERLRQLQSVLAKCDQTRVLLWNITLQAADTAYSDALSFYGSAFQSAKRKVETAKAVYKGLFPFFKKTKRAGAAPAQKEVTRDFNAVLRGKKDGEVTVRNVKPKVIKGRREAVDVEFTTNKHEAN